MDEQERTKLKLIKGKCAGKEGACENTDLILDGLCPECGAEEIDQAVTAAQDKFSELMEKFPEIATRDQRERFNKQPFIGFVQEMAGLRADVRDGNFPGLAKRALSATTRMTLWQADLLNDRVGLSSPEGRKKSLLAHDLVKKGQLKEAIETANEAIALFEPFEQTRTALAKRMAERRRPRTEDKPASTEGSSDNTGSQAQAV